MRGAARCRTTVRAAAGPTDVVDAMRSMLGREGHAGAPRSRGRGNGDRTPGEEKAGFTAQLCGAPHGPGLSTGESLRFPARANAPLQVSRSALVWLLNNLGRHGRVRGRLSPCRGGVCRADDRGSSEGSRPSPRPPRGVRADVDVHATCRPEAWGAGVGHRGWRLLHGAGIAHAAHRLVVVAATEWTGGRRHRQRAGWGLAAPTHPCATRRCLKNLHAAQGRL